MPEGSPSPDGALRGVRVIVTRTPDRGAALLELLRERGADPVLVPVQEAEPVGGKERRELLGLLGRAAAGSADRSPLWLVVTSANTVRALAQLAQDEHGLRLGQLLAPGLERGLAVAAVGPATTAELEAHGVPVRLQPHRTASAAGLLETWASPEEQGPGGGPGTVLLPQSAAASPDLARGLRELGWTVEHRVAYRMAPWPSEAPLVPAPAGPHDAVRTVPQARRELAEGSVGAAILTAPSTVRALGRDGAEALRSLGLAVIGRPTHEAVVELGLEAVVAESTDPPGLLEALERAVAQAAGPPPRTDETDAEPQEDRDD